MYERFYNLRERPFALSPDPDYLYPSRVHREALGYLRYGIEGYAGFVVITGDIGCGKTTLLQTVLRGLDRQTSISRLVNTMLDARELIEAVMLDFGLNPAPGQSKPHLLRELARYLVDQRSADRLALLVIDEAQNLSLNALEEVRMLSNLETEKSKLLQIVLVGQPNLRYLMSRPELEQLRQRVTVSYHLHPLASDETAAYVNHRLRRAAVGAPLQFPSDVTDLIHQHSGGVPRKINVISDAILLFGYGEERKVIDVELTNEVMEELASTGIIGPPQPMAYQPPASQPLGAPQGVPPIGAPAMATPGVIHAAPVSPAPAAVAAAPPAIGAANAPIGVPSPASFAAGADNGVAAREARLAERERQLAEQQRLLFEGYRMLRAEHDRGPASASGSARPAPPRTDGPSGPAPRPAAAEFTSFSSSRQPVRPSIDEPDTFWVRVRRGLAGIPKFILED
jgi:putative secretion ATPase (PEP-CTERM system associated)